MEHLILWLYIMTFMTGVIAVTLGSLFYIKTRKKAVGFIILADLYLGLSVLLDIFNFYITLFRFEFPEWIMIMNAYGLLLVNIGFISYLLWVVYDIIGRKVEKPHKVIFAGISTVFVAADLFIHFLTLQQVISGESGLHTGFLIANLFIVMGAFYGVFLIIKNGSKVNPIIQPFVRVCLIIIMIFGPISVGVNLINYRLDFRFPVAFSPITYLLINIGGILMFKNVLIDPESVLEKDKEGADEEQSLTHKDLLRSYEITEREYEIIQLILAGNSNQVIGEQLYISPHTVRNHIYNIYKKMGFKNRYELMNFLMQGKDNSEGQKENKSPAIEKTT